MRYFIFIFLLLFSCNKSTPQKLETFKKHDYQSKNFEEYLSELTDLYQKDYENIYLSEYDVFCIEHEIEKENPKNKKQYFQLKFLNDLFSSSNARNGSVGVILNIPYMWHWCNPNQRHSIQHKNTKEKLVNIKPSKEFGKYKTFADIDRIPFLYLDDFMSEEIKYKNESYDEILTFGWCSEREMAFNSILEILGYNSKIFTKDNHCWTEILIDFTNKSNNKITLNAHIDNTFHQFYFDKLSTAQLKNWSTNFGNLSMGKWYNEKAHSVTEIERIKKITIHSEKVNYIDQKINEFITKQK